MTRNSSSRLSKDAASAEALAVGARLYYECAVAAHERLADCKWALREHGELHEFRLVHFTLYPIFNGLCHAVELALKSYLKSNGVSPGERHGHKIRDLYKKCAEEAKSSNRSFPQFNSDLLNAVHDCHAGAVFRYAEQPKEPRLPRYLNLKEMVETLLRRLDSPEFINLGSRQ